MSDQTMTELEALRAYFEAHMDMHHATTEEAFARLYVKANLARDRLLEIAGGEPATCGTCHAAPLPGHDYCPDCRDEWPSE